MIRLSRLDIALWPNAFPPLNIVSSHIMPLIQYIKHCPTMRIGPQSFHTVQSHRISSSRPSQHSRNVSAPHFPWDYLVWCRDTPATFEDLRTLKHVVYSLATGWNRRCVGGWRRLCRLRESGASPSPRIWPSAEKIVSTDHEHDI